MAVLRALIQDDWFIWNTIIIKIHLINSSKYNHSFIYFYLILLYPV